MRYAIEDILPACAHYRFTDSLFLQGYNLLLSGDLTNKRVLEICCGEGDLAAWLGRMSPAEIVGIDISEEAIRKATRKHGQLQNVIFKVADALELSDFPAGTFDIVVGQATLHHLSHALPTASKECSRVLKPGGKCLFIFEPLGHNPLIAALRGAVNAASQYQWLDESMLFEWAIKDFAGNFARYEIYYFSLLAYGCKLLPRRLKLSRLIYNFCDGFDQRLFRLAKWTRKYAGNFNVCYWK